MKAKDTLPGEATLEKWNKMTLKKVMFGPFLLAGGGGTLILGSVTLMLWHFRVEEDRAMEN